MSSPRSRRPFALRLVRALLPPAERQAALDELEELYEARSAAEGRDSGDRWLRRESWRFAARLLVRRLRHPPLRALLPLGEAGRDVLRGLRIAARTLRRAPVFAVSTSAVVALGIGGATTVFAVVHGVLLRPLPYPAEDRLVVIRNARPGDDFAFSMADYVALEEQQTSFERVAAFDPNGVTLTLADGSERREAYMVTAGYLSLLGIQPALGRGIGEADTRPDAEPVALISDGLWNSHFGRDPGIVGRTVTIDDRTVTVAGVLPAARDPLTRDRDLIMPLVVARPPRKGPFFLNVLGLLSPTSSRLAAQEELRAINERIFPIWRDSFPDAEVRWTMLDLEEWVLGGVAPVLWVAMGAVAALLLIALTNAMNLLVARSLARRREAAVRAALGAGRARLAGNAVAESLILAGAGAAGGLALALLGLRLVGAIGGPFIPRIAEVALGAPVLAFVGAITALAVACLTLAPVIQSRATYALHLGGSRTASVGGRGRRLRETLVVAQIAVTVPLLVGGALLVTSLASLRGVDPGFDPKRVLTMGVTLPATGYESAASVTQFWQRVLAEMRAVPGVEAAGIGNGRPPDDPGFGNNFVLEDLPLAPGESQPTSPWTIAEPEFFAALGVELLAGRMFDVGTDSSRVALVDESWARRFFGEPADALDRRFVHGGCTDVERCDWWSVIGVVGDLEFNGLAQDDEGVMYLDAQRFPQRGVFVFVRSATEDPGSLVDPVRRILQAAEPRAPIADVATGSELLGQSLRRDGFLTALIALFGAVALLLSLVGLYGVVSYLVEQRRRDIGIRLALGGRPGHVAALVIGTAMGFVALGAATGAVLALTLSTLLERVLFEVDARDPGAVAAVVLGLLAAALVACLVPALRAARLDPARTLQEA